MADTNLADRVRRIEAALRASVDGAADVLLVPCESRTAEGCYMQAAKALRRGALDVARQLDALATDMEHAEAIDGLLATLAAIVAEGHEVVELSRAKDGCWGMHTQTATAGEFGTVRDTDPEFAARERLEWIRETHGQKIAADGISADVPPRVIHRAMDELAAEQARRTDAASEEGS